MKGFGGFPAGKQPYTPVPNLFFTEVLPDVDHLGELKLTLHLFWLLAQKRAEQPYVTREELAADGRLVAGLAAHGVGPDEGLDEALDRAVARGTLRRVLRGEGARQQELYFLNSERGRQAMDELLAGRWAPDGRQEPVRLEEQRPNIFVLYENNIGALTPILREELMEDEQTYPPEWIEDAVREAVELNKRSWRYVRAILARWATEGRGDEASRRRDEDDWRRFLRDGYDEFLHHK